MEKQRIAFQKYQGPSRIYSLWIPLTMIDAMSKLAEKLNCSVSQLVRKAIEKYLEENQE